MDAASITLSFKNINIKLKGITYSYNPPPSSPGEPQKPAEPHEYTQAEISIPEITISGLSEKLGEMILEFAKSRR